MSKSSEENPNFAPRRRTSSGEGQEDEDEELAKIEMNKPDFAKPGPSSKSKKAKPEKTASDIILPQSRSKQKKQIIKTKGADGEVVSVSLLDFSS